MLNTICSVVTKMSMHVNSSFESMSCVGEYVSHSPGGIYCMLFFLALQSLCVNRDGVTDRQKRDVKYQRYRETESVSVCVIERQRHWMSESEMLSLENEKEEEKSCNRWSLSISLSVFLPVRSTSVLSDLLVLFSAPF